MNEIEDKRKAILCKMCKKNKIIMKERFGRRKYCDSCILERGKISHVLHPISLEKRREEYRRNKNTYKKRNKIKDNHIYSIRQHTSYLERKGEIKRDKECSFCLSNIELVKHHPNYNQPNRFVTLCKDCHNKLHNTKVVFNNSQIKETFELGKKKGVEMARRELQEDRNKLQERIHIAFNQGKEEARKEFGDKINNIINRIDNNELNEGGIHNEHEYCIYKDGLFKELKSLSEGTTTE